jgi:uncharacterized protein
MLHGTLALAAVLAAADGPPVKVLMLTKSEGFQHSVVARKGDDLGLAERTVRKLADAAGYQIDITKDCSVVTADKLKEYKLVFLYTQGNITKPGNHDKAPGLTAAGRDALLAYVRGGGGLVCTHCGGTDTLHGDAEFLGMVGGEFDGHGGQRKAKVEIVDPSFPAMAHFPRTFSLHDEWYTYKGFGADIHVLAMLKTEGFPEAMYRRPDYPITWCSAPEKGRVFYTGMGHREDVWENPDYHKMLTGAMAWAAGETKADASPNLGKLFGDADAALKRINTKGSAPPRPAKKQ